MSQPSETRPITDDLSILSPKSTRHNSEGIVTTSTTTFQVNNAKRRRTRSKTRAQPLLGDSGISRSLSPVRHDQTSVNSSLDIALTPIHTSQMILPDSVENEENYRGNISLLQSSTQKLSTLKVMNTPEMVPLNMDSRGPLRKGTPLRPTSTTSSVTSKATSGGYGGMNSRSTFANSFKHSFNDVDVDDDEFEDEEDRVDANDTLSSNIPDDLRSPEFRRQDLFRKTDDDDMNAPVLLDTSRTTLSHKKDDNLEESKKTTSRNPPPKFELNAKSMKSNKFKSESNLKSPTKTSPLRNVVLERSIEEFDTNEPIGDTSSTVPLDHSKKTTLYPVIEPFVLAPEIHSDNEEEEELTIHKDNKQQNRQEDTNKTENLQEQKEEKDRLLVSPIDPSGNVLDSFTTKESDPKQYDDNNNELSMRDANTGLPVSHKNPPISYNKENSSKGNNNNNNNNTNKISHRRSMIDNFLNTLNRLDSGELFIRSPERSNVSDYEGHSIREELEEKFGSSDDDIQPPILNYDSFVNIQKTPESVKSLLAKTKESIERFKTRKISIEDDNIFQRGVNFKESRYELESSPKINETHQQQSISDAIEESLKDEIPLNSSTVIKQFDSNNRIMESPILERSVKASTLSLKRPYGLISPINHTKSKRQRILRLGPYENWTRHQWTIFRGLYRKFTKQGRDFSVFNNVKYLTMLRIYNDDELTFKIQFWENCLKNGKVKF